MFSRILHEIMPHKVKIFDSGSKADIWSVGGVIYQMVTGSPPWKDIGFKSPIALFMHLKSHDNPPKLPQLKNCDDHNYQLLENISARCFQRNPSMRPTASSLLSDSFLNSNVTLTPKAFKPLIETPTKNCNPPSPTFKSPLNKIPENVVLNTSPTDSLCYSLTLKSPLPDASEWPDWAKQSNKENEAYINGMNPFKKSDKIK